MQQDVLGLDVAVDDAVAVGVRQRGGHRAHDPERDVDRELPLARQPVAQRLAPGVGHDEIEQAVAFARVVERENLGMGQPRGDADLAQEALGLVPVAPGRAEHLHRHLTPVLQVLRQIDRGGTAAADLLQDAISVGDGAEALGDVGHLSKGIGGPPEHKPLSSGSTRLM